MLSEVLTTVKNDEAIEEIKKLLGMSIAPKTKPNQMKEIVELIDNDSAVVVLSKDFEYTKSFLGGLGESRVGVNIFSTEKLDTEVKNNSIDKTKNDYVHFIKSNKSRKRLILVDGSWLAKVNKSLSNDLQKMTDVLKAGDLLIFDSLTDLDNAVDLEQSITNKICRIVGLENASISTNKEKTNLFITENKDSKKERTIMPLYDIPTILDISVIMDKFGMNHYKENDGVHYFYKPPFTLRKLSDKIWPDKSSFEEIWNAWDYLIKNIIQRQKDHTKPILLRHPFIFYYGHIPAFADIFMNKYNNTRITNKQYTLWFERGIDPDVDDPTKCHGHSEIPKEWPSFEELIEYEDKIKLKLYEFINDNKMNRRKARIINMIYEHIAMHLETLSYIIVQGSTFNKIDNVYYDLKVELPVKRSNFIKFEAGTIQTGLQDNEAEDLKIPNNLQDPIGWDNEMGLKTLSFESFQIQSRQITNHEYLQFVKEFNLEYPKQWMKKDNLIFIKTLIGYIEFEKALNWPVMLSHKEATEYLEHKNMRLPTEAELLKLREYSQNINLNKESVIQKNYNVGLRFFHPISVENKTLFSGNGWEWTSTIFDTFEDYVQSELYKGYSADFFDKKHFTLLGGSYISHDCIAKRKSFRNWYQFNYPYMFACFRGVQKSATSIKQ